MPLTLEVIGEKAARMGGAVRKTFTAGGTIGRLPDNDWVLPDRYISGHHARISLANGAFTIEDTSTNGVFINSPQNRLTRNKPYPLRSGDTIFIDDYEVRVTVAAEPAVVESYAPARSAASSGSSIPDDPFDGLPGAGGSAGTPPGSAGFTRITKSARDPGRTGAECGRFAKSVAAGAALSATETDSTAADPRRRHAACGLPQRRQRIRRPGFIPDDYDPMRSRMRIHLPAHLIRQCRGPCRRCRRRHRRLRCLRRGSRALLLAPCLRRHQERLQP